MDPPQPGERDLIELLLRSAHEAPAEGPGAPIVGPGDDGAVLADGTVVTTDTLVEGVHFDDRLSAADVGWKCVAVSVSDLASMGARPAWMLLSMSLPSPLDPSWAEDFAAGVGEATRRWAVPLVGGDTTGSPGPRIVGVTMGGRCAGAPITRSAARPGDAIWVTGFPGLAGAGYLMAHPPAAALAALRRPDPPLALALALAEAGVITAMMDLSDGLAADLPRLCVLSGVGAVLSPSAIPLHPALEGTADPLLYQLAAGDDYQLLLTAPPDIDLSRLAGDTPIHRIGHITEDTEVRLEGDRNWPGPGFDHFGSAP